MWVEIKAGKRRYYERYKDPMTGKWRRVCVTLDHKADKKAHELLQNKIADRLSSYGDKTLAQSIELYGKDAVHFLRTATLERNKAALNSMKELLGGYVLMNKLTAAFIREQLLTSGKKARTLNGYLERFKAFIRWAYRSDLIASTACIDKLEPFKEESMRSRIKDKYLDTEELKTLLDGMEPGNRLITEFLVLSGMRIGELIALEDKDVGTVIHITKTFNPTVEEITPGKTVAAVRDIHVQPELADCIKRLRSLMRLRKLKSGTRSLFVVGEAGERLNYYTYNKAFKAATRKLLGRELTPHVLRHTHASLLAAKGYSLEAISRRLGHDNSKVTRNIYLHITEEMRKKDAENLDKITLLPFSCPFSDKEPPESVSGGPII